MTSPENPVRKKQKPWKRLLNWSIGIIATAGVAWFVYPMLAGHSGSAVTHETTSVTSKAPEVVTITSGQVQTRPVRRTVNVVGTLFGYEEISISANVDGRVSRLMADVSSRMTAGAQLAVIDPTNFELAVRQSQRSLDVELARLGLTAVPDNSFDIDQLPMVREARSRLTFARNTEQRTRQLSQSNAVSAQDLESAIADLQSAQASFENQELQARAALATIKMRAEALAIAQQQLDDTVIVAPTPEEKIPFIDHPEIYAISSRSVSEGTFVRTGTEVFQLVIDDALRLRVAVPERHLGDIATGQSAEVRTAAYAEPVLGTVSRINPVITASTRTFEVEILVDNSAHRLKPGGFAKARIITRSDDTAIIVPLESLVTFAGITKIFLVENDQAREVQVDVGQQGSEWIEIVSPQLQPGATVVTSGQTALSHDTPVVQRVVPPAEPNASHPEVAAPVSHAPFSAAQTSAPQGATR